MQIKRRDRVKNIRGKSSGKPKKMSRVMYKVGFLLKISKKIKGRVCDCFEKKKIRSLFESKQKWRTGCDAIDI